MHSLYGYILIIVGKAWPVAMGGGFGIGFAMSNCQHEFKRLESLYLIPQVSAINYESIIN